MCLDEPLSCFRKASYWPRRLLHIPSFHSYERRPGNVYGDASEVVEPPYATISYPWGRFEQLNGDSISVSGIDWDVPAINPNHFTRQEFETVIRKIAYLGTVNFVWVDVACLNQSTRPNQTSEAFYQGNIFSGASIGCVWLSKTTSSDFKEIICCFQKIQRLVAEDIGEHHAVTRCKSITESDRFNLVELQEALKTLLSDPWWTSLWTLQEAFAKPDAILFLRDGLPLKRAEWLEKPSSTKQHSIMDTEDSVDKSAASGRPYDSAGTENKMGHTWTVEADTGLTEYFSLRDLVQYSHVVLKHLSMCERDLAPLRLLDNLSTSLRQMLEKSGLPYFLTFELSNVDKLAQHRYEARSGDRRLYLRHAVHCFPLSNLRTRVSSPDHSGQEEIGFELATFSSRSQSAGACPAVDERLINGS